MYPGVSNIFRPVLPLSPPSKVGLAVCRRRYVILQYPEGIRNIICFPLWLVTPGRSGFSNPLFLEPPSLSHICSTISHLALAWYHGGLPPRIKENMENRAKAMAVSLSFPITGGEMRYELLVLHIGTAFPHTHAHTLQACHSGRSKSSRLSNTSASAFHDRKNEREHNNLDPPFMVRPVPPLRYSSPFYPTTPAT